MNKNDILMIHGTDYRKMAYRIMEKADVSSMIGDKNKKIGLKPNLVNATHPSKGAVTHPEVLAGAIEYLTDHGFSDIVVTESSWAGEKTGRALKAAKYEPVLKAYNIPFADLQKDSYSVHDAAGIRLNICDIPLSLDYMINIPVLKGHCQTKITCALKNNKGLIPNTEKRRFHTMGLHKPIAHLNTVVRNDFILVDNICGDLEYEEGGTPVTMNRILGFCDPVLCDAFVIKSMGYTLNDVEYVRLAESLGVGSADIDHAKIIKLNEARDGEVEFPKTRRVRKLAEFVKADNACSVCYGSLIHALNRLDQQDHLDPDLPKLAIGQGYRGIQLDDGSLGIGSCTSGFPLSCKGCAPSGADIRSFLEKHWIKKTR